MIIATQHRGDHQSLQRLLASNVGYIALIASRKRTALVIDYLRKAAFDQPALDRIRAPAGIDIGARTAEEIALSVISESVLERRSRTPQRVHGSTPANVFLGSTTAARRPALLSDHRRAAGE